MSSGSSEVELWGGENGVGSIQASNADFYFLKAAVDPNKDVEESETDNKPGMITDILYQIDEDQETKLEPKRVRQRPKLPEESDPYSTTTTPTRTRCRLSSPPSYVRKRPSIVPIEDSKPYDTSYSSRRRISNVSSPIEGPKSPEIFSSTRCRPSTTSGENEVGSYYLRPPGRSTTDTSSSYNPGLRSRENNRASGGSSTLSSSSLREPTRSRYGDTSSTSSTSRFGRESSVSSSTPSRFGQSSSSYTDTSSRFGRDSSSSRTGSKDYTPSIYRRDSTSRTSSTGYTSRYGTTSTGSSTAYSGYASRFGRFGR